MTERKGNLAARGKLQSMRMFKSGRGNLLVARLQELLELLLNSNRFGDLLEWQGT